MDSATEEKHFEKLDECIKDDDKIITVPSLSRILNIPLTDTQHILSKYVEKQRKMQSDELSLTYVLTGTIKDIGKAVVIVKESDLEDKRTTFDKVESEVLFSVQKCSKIDFNILSLVDDVTLAKKEPLLGSIVSKNCIKRVLKIKKLPPPPLTTVKGKSSHFLASNTPPVKTEKSEEKSKGNGISNKFDKAAPPADKPKSEKKPSIESIKNKQKSGISAFFSKSTSTSNSSLKSETSIKTENSTDNDSLSHGIEELMEVDFKELDEVENKIKDDQEMKVDNPIIVDDEKDVKEEKKKESKKSDGKEKKTKNKRQRDKSEEKNQKKRKRIIQRNDSESDDMFEKDEADIIEKSDEEIERAPSPVAKKPLAPKNKIRKAVDKTYMDEEGFLVTKTEYVFESAPEDDEEVPMKKETTIKPQLQKKTSASSEADVSPPKNAKGKKGKKNNLQNQPTLMNFFKKK